MVTFSINYRGELRCQVEHGPSKTTLVTDAPRDNHGRGESFSPTDLVATGLATCILTTMAIVAKRDGIDFTTATASAEKHMSATPPRTIAKLVVAITMPKGLTKDQRSKLEKAAHSCPVALSLSPAVQQVVTFTYPE